MATLSSIMRRDRGDATTPATYRACLWVIALGVAIGLAYVRWSSWSGTIGGDFDYTLAAAREIGDCA